MQLDELGYVDAGCLGRRGAQLTESLPRFAVLAQRRLGGAGQRRRLQQRDDVVEGVGTQTRRERGDGPVVADEQGGGCQQLREVGGASALVRPGRRLREVRDHRASVDDHDIAGVQLAVRDQRVVQCTHLVPEIGQQIVGRFFGTQIGEDLTVRRASDDERSTRTGGSGDDDVGDLHPGALGEQQDVGLVLHVLLAGQVQLRTGVLVDHEAPQLREELAVGLVATDDTNRQRALIVLRKEARRAGRLCRIQMHVTRRHAELRE